MKSPNQIKTLLQQIEAEEGVRIVYACESGSRAWGFPSADSDYDVRFLYARPATWYLSIDKKRDVIERPISDDVDATGWDLRKTLGLFNKSNPYLFEWLGSPIVYVEQGDVAARMRSLFPRFFSRTTCARFYLAMARHRYKEVWHGSEIRLKPYFYVIRCLLALRWLERGLGVVPTVMDVLVERVADSPALQTAIRELVVAKSTGKERDRWPDVTIVSQFVETELARFQEMSFTPEPRAGTVEELSTLFRDTLHALWDRGSY